MHSVSNCKPFKWRLSHDLTSKANGCFCWKRKWTRIRKRLIFHSHESTACWRSSVWRSGAWREIVCWKPNKNGTKRDRFDRQLHWCKDIWHSWNKKSRRYGKHLCGENQPRFDRFAKFGVFPIRQNGRIARFKNQGSRPFPYHWWASLSSWCFAERPWNEIVCIQQNERSWRNNYESFEINKSLNPSISC